MQTRLFSIVGVLTLAVLLGIGSGCVQRRMTIRSNPPGARVYVDDYEIGSTPISKNFNYYGKRKIRLVKEGYETLTVLQDIPPTWYELTPIDFMAENMVPGEIRDQRTLDYQLMPQMVVPTDQLMARAENLRRTSHGNALPGQPGLISPPGSITQPGTIPQQGSIPQQGGIQSPSGAFPQGTSPNAAFQSTVPSTTVPSTTAPSAIQPNIVPPATQPLSNSIPSY